MTKVKVVAEMAINDSDVLGLELEELVAQPPQVIIETRDLMLQLHS